jgi:hypothetical protein
MEAPMGKDTGKETFFAKCVDCDRKLKLNVTKQEYGTEKTVTCLHCGLEQTIHILGDYDTAQKVAGLVIQLNSAIIDGLLMNAIAIDDIRRQLNELGFISDVVVAGMVEKMTDGMCSQTSSGEIKTTRQSFELDNDDAMRLKGLEIKL